MKTEVIETEKEFYSLIDHWNSLLKKSSSDHIYLTHEWLHCWWKAFGNGRRPFILLIKDNDQAIGIVPLLVATISYRKFFKIREISFWGNEISPRIDFICLAGFEQIVIEALIEYLFKNIQIWDVFSLAKLPENSKTVDILCKVLSKRKVTFRIAESIKSPFLDINSDWETYYATRTTKFRKGMRNKINRMQKEGTCQVEMIHDSEKLVEMLPVIYEISNRSWKQLASTSFGADKKQAAFYRELTEIVGDKGWINIWLLKYNGAYIAFEYHLVYGGMIHTIRGDYDQTFSKLSPGSFLEYYILKHHFEQSKEIEYDFCGDNYQYMRNWTENARNHVSMRIFNKTFRGWLVATADCFLIPVVRKTIQKISIPFRRDSKKSQTAIEQ